MDFMMESSLEQLEFHRLLDHVAGLSASSLGVEHIRNLRPGSEVEDCRRSVRLVGEMVAILERDEIIPLHGIWDVREALSISRIPGSVLSAETLLRIGWTVAAVRKVRDFFLRRSESAPLLANLVRDAHVNRLVEKHIEDAIDDVGNVRDNASRDLARIRREIIDRSAALRARLQKILRRVSDEELVTDEYVTLREGRLVLPVRAEAKRKIPGVIHGESQSGGTVFLEPAEIFDMNNEISELTFAERREVERILRTLTEEIGSESHLFLLGVTTLREVDSVWARARYSQKNGCCEPEIVETNEILLYDARHPLLQLRLDSVVPMSLELDAECRAVIVSGPNAGGKTVAMKTLGLVAALALSGIHPPAARCVVHPCSIFSDIGDQQSLENDLSTFSSHMSRISGILSAASEGDIVLLDEVGTGTDPDEGGAIAAAILDSLLAKGAYVMCTTHHSYLKVYAYQSAAVENAGMEFNTDTITPTYRFMPGVPGNSYAFELLSRLGFDNSVLRLARARMGEERNRLTEIIGELEGSLQDGRRMREEAMRLRSEAESERNELQAQLKALQSQRKDLLDEAKVEARRLVSEANSQIENALREIKEGATADRVRELRKQIDDARKDLAPDTSLKVDTEHANPGLSVGDAVRMKDGTQVGEVVTDVDDKGYVVVQYGSIRMRSHADELELVTRREARKAASSGRIPIANAEEATTRIDIRGMYPDEAEIRLEQGITAAINANITLLDVIHGKGTGALRKRVHEYLRKHPGVASFRLGALTEGGAGITIVELA